MRDFIKIEIMCECNQACDYCFRKPARVAVNIPDVIEKMERIFALYDYRNTVFRIEGTGEITLYPELIEYLNTKAKESDWVFDLLSNGVLAETLMAKYQHLHWTFSLDGNTIGMNHHRKLTQEQITKILELAIRTSSEIQCVYTDQSITEMNGFISYLKSKSYKGFLHIFPCRKEYENVDILIDYRNLLLTDFTPPKEYFKRWEYIFLNHRRDFLCDFYTNGYVYRISPDSFKEVKCDCPGERYIRNNFGDKDTAFSIEDCGTCINHFEYNNSRRIMQVPCYNFALNK